MKGFLKPKIVCLWVIGRPKPVPEFDVVKNGLNKLGITSSGIPGPLSEIIIFVLPSFS